MTAILVTALRVRAAELETEAAQIAEHGEVEGSHRSYQVVHTLATEFAGLADLLEAPLPPGGP